MSEEKSTNVFIENMKVLASPEGMQKYIFGSKKNGTPRAVYDIVKDYTKPSKKKKKKDKKKHKHSSSSGTSFEFYLQNSSGKKKKKNKKNKKKKSDKYWHI